MNNQLLQILMEEEEDDDDLLLLYYSSSRPILPFYRNRLEEGSYETLIKRHLNISEELFRSYCRLNKNQFNFVLSLIYDDLKPKTLKNTITPEEKLFITLRFMATGESYASLSFQYRISRSYISRMVKRVLHLLRLKLVAICMPPPTKNDFQRIEREFWDKWNMPNCVGSIDGKHIRIRAPQHSGSLFFNYKEYFSIVLLAIADSNYKFIAVDVGSYGKEGDSNIFKKSEVGKKIQNNTFNFPEPKKLPGTNDILPHFLIGDEAFALDTFMMKPYSQRIARHDK
ncbi:protein ALP1-like [Maniola jurtina]|uniref:protein ALP1-like n=1 Tax=Maniola jurtina TaxID=191418 RepID=UPI001E6862D2|nr:protein ALP1-like [Maniola jurtina]